MFSLKTVFKRTCHSPRIQLLKALKDIKELLLLGGSLLYLCAGHGHTS